MFKRMLCFTLTALLISGSIATSASAAVIGTREALVAESRTEQLSAVEAKLARSDVQAAMIALGVNPADAASRVDSLNDQELVELNHQLDQLPAGGDALVIIGIVFLVLLILEVTGVTNVFHGA